MFRKLHLQLTALCIAITGLILAVLSCICLFISESGVRRQEYTSFLASLNTMYQNMEQQDILSHSWIRQMEHNYRFSLRITDNGAPLLFQSLEETTIPDELWTAVEETAREEYHFDLKVPGTLSVLTRHEEFPMTYDARRYNASAALIPRGSGVIGVLVLQPLSPMETRIFRQRLAFLLADLTALALLGIFYWFFTAHMLRPFIENRKKQMQFVASASHELRSPLTVILSNVSAVRGGAMEGDSHFLDVIDSEGKRMSRLIADMLQLAGADSRTWSIRPAKVEMDTLLLRVFESFESMAAARGLRWEISLPEVCVPPCVCDEERIRQLLSILIDNAFCYTPAGGRVRLALSLTGNVENPSGQESAAGIPSSGQSDIRSAKSVRRNPVGSPLIRRPSPVASPLTARRNPVASPLIRRPANHSCLYITVSDNGPGIPDDRKEAVFERFYRLDRSRTDKSHFGLGLCIAQEIARLHHGQITLSDTPGGGATFLVTLPFSAASR